MSTVSTTLPNDGETIDAADVNTPFNAIISVLNGNVDSTNITSGSLPWSVMASFTNTIPSSALQDSANIEKYRQDSKIGFVVSGLVWSALTGLNGAMTLGVAYAATTGVRLSIAAIASRTFTASKDTYVYLDGNGAIAYSEVANNANAPTLGSVDGQWLAKVVTSGSAITSVTDLRKLQPSSQILGADMRVPAGTLLTTTYTVYGVVSNSSRGGDIIINTAAIIRDANSGAARDGNWKIQMDGVDVANSERRWLTPNSGNVVSAASIVVHRPSAGAHVWTLLLMANVNSATALDHASIEVMER